MRPGKRTEEKVTEEKVTEENSLRIPGSCLILEAAAFGFVLLGIFMTGVCLQVSNEMMLRNLVMAALGTGMVGLLFRLGFSDGELPYDNQENAPRYWLCYLGCLAVSFACVFLPVGGWPFMVVFLLLSLFGSSLTGIVGASVLLMISVYLSGAQLGTFMLYFISGTLAVCLFRKLDGDFKVGIPLWISVMVLVVCETANLVLFTDEHLNAEMFVIPIANAIVNCILMIGILKVFSARVIYRYRVRYMELTDPEYCLLTEFKEQARQDYYQSVHTAYFCDRIGRRLNLDSEALKTAGYYHRLECLCKCNNEEREKLFEEHFFPPAARKILREYMSGTGNISKETVVLILADAVTASVMYVFSSEQEDRPDYGRIIEAVFDRKMKGGTLKDGDITLREITLMKKIFKEEELYYDFLR